jgi:N-methylhydantoinase A/oxoprolinase/acetone carboxylase beta subunit
MFYTMENVPTLTSRLDVLTNATQKELKQQGFASEHIQVKCLLNMRFNGMDAALMVLPEAGESASDHLRAFHRAYKAKFRFLLVEAHVMEDNIKVHGIGTTSDKSDRSVFDKLDWLSIQVIEAKSATIYSTSS